MNSLPICDLINYMNAEEEEDKEWSQFSAAQLARAYSPEDSIYDEEREAGSS